jgi:hypothetical protein
LFSELSLTTSIITDLHPNNYSKSTHVLNVLFLFINTQLKVTRLRRQSHYTWQFRATVRRQQNEPQNTRKIMHVKQPLYT